MAINFDFNTEVALLKTRQAAFTHEMLALIQHQYFYPMRKSNL